MKFRVIPDAVMSLLRGTPLPYFRVAIEGRGIAVPADSGEDTIGFFTTRSVRAFSEDDAIAKGVSVVEDDWTSGDFAQWTRGVTPKVSVDKVWRDTFLGALRFQNGVHSFFWDDSPNEAAAVSSSNSFKVTPGAAPQ